MSTARIRELLAKADCLTPLEVELRNEISPLLNQVERLEGAVRAGVFLMKAYKWHELHTHSIERVTFDEMQAALRGEGG